MQKCYNYQLILSTFRMLFIDRSISANAGQYLDLLTRLFLGLSLIRPILIYRYTFKNMDVSIHILKYRYTMLKSSYE